MDRFADRFVMKERNPAGVMFVILLHVMLVYALMNGLGRTLVQAIKPTNEVTLVKEAPPPKPPEMKIIPKPEVAPVQNVTVPIPEFKVETPPEPTIAVTPVENPAPAPVAAVQGTPDNTPTVAVRKEFKAAYRVEPVYPREARTQNITGKVVAHVYVAPNGSVTRVQIISSTHHVFDREVVRALSLWKFNPEAVGFVGEYEIAFNLKD
ncbi:MAG TPA: TonB family protein [Usitatibacter sp.]|nr:TonB family protein [Usitatibacter sp.]